MADDIDYEQLVLTAVQAAPEGAPATTLGIASANGLEHQKIVGAVKSLEAEAYIATSITKVLTNAVTEEGQGYFATGSPEKQLFDTMRRLEAELTVTAVPEPALKAAMGDGFDAAKNAAMGKKWVTRDKATASYSRTVPDVEDETVAALSAVAAGHDVDAKVFKSLVTRKLAVVNSTTVFIVTKGAKFAPERKRLPADITKAMLDSGEWETAEFRKYNLESEGLPVGGGHLHALMKVRAEFRSILLEMGFQEMPTSRYVESSFWNFDALFQPQSHPSRDMHDTFFLKTAATTLHVPEDYLARVKDVHENGGYGSVGYGCEWKKEEAFKNVLRTHTTAVSARMLYLLANPGGFKPIKYFSIDRVFRNESLDATHLAEFHQVEGVVADYNLSLGHLIGVIAEFFRRIGITDIRFKPAFNPYTEPSMEIFGYHPDLKKWTEIGNCIPAEDQILTAHGFLNHSELREVLAARGTIQVACYDAATRSITYEAIDASRVIAKEGVHSMVQLDSGKTDNGVSLVVTGNHELYLRFGQQKSGGRYQWPMSSPSKVHAARLLEHKEADAVQLTAIAAEGLASASELPCAAPLKLVTDDSVGAFLELFGYWLGNGSLDLNERTISFQATSNQYLDGLLSQLPLERVETYADVTRGWWKGETQDGGWLYAIGEPVWWRFFVDEYGSKYQQDALPADSTTCTPRDFHVAHTCSKSAKWLYGWMLTCLGKAHARCLITGLRSADGDHTTFDKSREGGQLRASSVRLRDEICRVLLHAGYSAHFAVDTEASVTDGTSSRDIDTTATAPWWTVHFSDQSRVATPSLPLKDSVSSTSYSGTVWCVNVPHKDHLIISRRVTETAADGSVRAASRPVVIGNSGIFRPEMLEPMGLPKDVRVIAWGLSLERPTMIKYRLKNIRDLFGSKVKLEMSAAAPIARFT